VTPTRRFPQRTCVACRTERQKRDLVRIVRTPTGELAFDASGRMNGRGAYLCADGSCWTAALKKSSLERALGVALPDDIRQRLETAQPVSPEGGPSGS
jgi:hypothetical protein